MEVLGLLISMGVIAAFLIVAELIRRVIAAMAVKLEVVTVVNDWDELEQVPLNKLEGQTIKLKGSLYTVVSFDPGTFRGADGLDSYNVGTSLIVNLYNYNMNEPAGSRIETIRKYKDMIREINKVKGLYSNIIVWRTLDGGASSVALKLKKV